MYFHVCTSHIGHGFVTHVQLQTTVYKYSVASTRYRYLWNRSRMRYRQLTCSFIIVRVDMHENCLGNGYFLVCFTVMIMAVSISETSVSVY
jgi:hypothetical protein